MPSFLHMCVHEYPDGERVFSIDLLKHHDVDGLMPQTAEIDEVYELLAMPTPPPLQVDVALTDPPPPAPPPPSPICVSGESKNMRVDRPLRTPSPKSLAMPSRAQTPPPQDRRSRERAAVRKSRRAHRAESDETICECVNAHGPRWREISKLMGGRPHGWSDDTVRNRYIRLMEAAGTPYKPKRTRIATPRKPERPVEPWTSEDDALIATAIGLHGTKWREVANYFCGVRTQQAVRNRANRVGLVEHGKVVAMVKNVE